MSSGGLFSRSWLYPSAQKAKAFWSVPWKTNTCVQAWKLAWKWHLIFGHELHRLLFSVGLRGPWAGQLWPRGPGVPRSLLQPWELAAFLLGALQWAACPGLPFSVLLLPPALPEARSPLQGVQSRSWSLHRPALVVCCLWFVFSARRTLSSPSLCSQALL